jgi:SAM-dependent methyltransferase
VAGFYERSGLNVETYDARTALQADAALADDVSFFTARARASGGPVLDLGTGTGRVAIPLARAGFTVVGLDLSPHMLAQARQKLEREPAEVRDRVRLVQGDMAAFDLGERFGLAVIPFRGFQIITTPQAQRNCLTSVHTHLRPGGILVLHLFDPLLQTLVPEETAAPHPDRGTVRHPQTGNEVRVRVLSRRNDPLRQVFDEEWLFEEVDAGGAVVRGERETLSLRWTYRYEMRYLLEVAGFTELVEYSDFRSSPPAYGREQVWLARRP